MKSCSGKLRVHSSDHLFNSDDVSDAYWGISPGGEFSYSRLKLRLPKAMSREQLAPLRQFDLFSRGSSDKRAAGLF